MSKGVSFIFFFNSPLETSYLRMYWNDLQQIFRIGTHVTWVGMINPTFYSRSLEGRCYGNRFLAKIGENWHTHTPSFCALAFHNGRDDCNVDARVNIADGSTTSDKNLVNFDPVPRFCRLARVGYTLGFATHFYVTTVCELLSPSATLAVNCCTSVREIVF